jgi:hypothetical protein
MANGLQPDLRSINGSNAMVLIDIEGEQPRVIGYATGVTVTEAIALNRIDVLGSIDSQDIEPIGRVVSGSIGLMRMTVRDKDGGGSGSQGLTPKHGGTDSIGRTKELMDFMTLGFDLQINDSSDFAPDQEARRRYTVKGCRPSSHSFALSRGMLMGVNVTFEALMLIEEDVG